MSKDKYYRVSGFNEYGAPVVETVVVKSPSLLQRVKALLKSLRRPKIYTSIRVGPK